MKRLLPAALLLAGLAGPVPAQPPRAYFPWWDSEVARDINLTAAQRDRIKEVQQRFRDQMIDQRAALEKAEARLEDIYDDDPIDEARASAAIEELISARGAMTRSLTLMSLDLRKVLTAGQWATLQKKIQQLRDRRFAGRRPGSLRDRGEPDPPPR
jgi:Spy/CpxP family protein refolding chaperone